MLYTDGHMNGVLIARGIGSDDFTWQWAFTEHSEPFVVHIRCSLYATGTYLLHRDMTLSDTIDVSVSSMSVEILYFHVQSIAFNFSYEWMIFAYLIFTEWKNLFFPKKQNILKKLQA